MARNGSGVYSLPAGSTVTNGDSSDATDINTPLADLEADANTVRPVVAGGTGAASAAVALVNLGLTATAAEINALDGITATVAELNYSVGVTSALQTQIDAKLQRAVQDISDWDTTKIAGFYRTVAANRNGGPAPTGLFDAWIFGESVSDDAVQMAVDKNSPFKVYIRRLTLDVWSAWSEVAFLDGPAFTGVPTAPTAAVGTDTTQVATTAFVQAANSFATYYESAEQVIAAAGTVTLTHGLGATPILLQAELVCKTADLNYAVGDRVIIPTYADSGNGVTFWYPSATQIKARFGTILAIINATTGSTNNITFASWTLVVRAWV